MESLSNYINEICKKLFNIDVDVELARTDEQFGDYATSFALKLSKQLNKNPREIAQSVADELNQSPSREIEQASVAGPGFLNIRLAEPSLIAMATQSKLNKGLKGQEILVEFGDPNPLKAMHLGHLYTTIVGDSLARLYETAGAEVKRLSYHGDVGMHVAKAIWGIGEQIQWDYKRLDNLGEQGIKTDDNMLNLKTMIGHLYSVGAKAFEDDPKAADEIRAINTSVYKKDRVDVNKIYEWGVKKSFEYFDLIFDELGVKYDKRYLESQTAEAGVQLVKDNLGKVFTESSGAVVYEGEKVGLHTRVFMTSEGLPTYEAKDLGLAVTKQKDYPNAKQSIIITANEQTEYFKVMLAALAEIDPAVADKTLHIAHGFLSLTTGKMSSRTGNVFGAQSLMDDTRATVAATFPDSKVQNEIYLAALKYTFLKNRIGGDIVFDIKESVSLEGNSGPYLQYAHARARGILNKSSIQPAKIEKLDADERSLILKISEYSEVVSVAAKELMPHTICTYLYELAHGFNRFYEKNRVIGDNREAVRLSIVKTYADTLQAGLETLGIPAPDQM